MAENKTELEVETAQQPRRGMMPGHGGPGAAAARGLSKPKNFGATAKKLLGTLKSYRLSIILTMVFAVIGTTFTIVSPKILGNMTNQIVDDYISIKVYDEVHKQLPAGLVLPKGTTVEKLPALLEQMAKQQIEAQIASGKITPQQAAAMAAQQSKSSKASQLQQMAKQVPAYQMDQIKKLDLSIKPTMHYDALAGIAFWLICLYVLSALFTYIQGWIITDVTQKITLKFRRDISTKINRLPISYFDRHSYGDVLSRVTNDVDTIAQSLNQSLSQIITSITTILGILVMMITISIALTGIAVIVVPISLIVVGIIIKYSQKYFQRQQDQLGDINGHIEETYAGHVVVKAFSAESFVNKKFTNINDSLYENAWKSQFLSGLMYPIMNIIGNLGYVGVAVMGGWLAINGKISIGDIQAFIQYTSQFNQPIMQVAQIGGILQSTIAAAERVFEFLEEPEEAKDVKNAKTLKSIKGEVIFDNVKFSYEKGKRIIKGFSAHIQPGQQVAIVGPTGAGKTTMVNLLMRFYDPDSGDIMVDGVNTRNMKRSDVRQMFGMVLQDTWLFNGTIQENLRYGDLQANQDEVKVAAKTAHVDHFVHSLPHGYDTILDEDADNISAGEKQLLTIARAMLANAPMMILDEATSSVDTRTEILIQQAMDKLTKGRTSFVIAHRLSTIKNADLILVMNEGDIIEQGNHQQLLAKNGFYANLYNSQFVDN
ncbi:ABC transporter ATP-binding protein/permease [Candidatus Saccharibacteria bacterium]|nr:ABC transporter ATP-binding protein/permease [Candidatus Saccharibacteria bacterium]